MERSDAARLGGILKLACSVYRQPFTEELLSAYITVLSDSDMDSVAAAAERHMKTSRFFPAPCDLLVSDSRSHELLALEAWRALKKGGPVPIPEVSTEALELVGGHQMLRELTIQDGPHRRREFVETFKLLMKEEHEQSLTMKIDSGLGLPS